jgi:formylglycine-generating enzyme required for sulfatase activity
LPGGPFLLGRRTEVCELPCTDGCPLDEDDETVCDPDEVPERVATASSFLLETFEVTVGRFENYVAAYDAWRESGHPDEGEGAHPRIPGSGWQSAWNTLLPASASAFATALGSCSETTHGGASSELPANCVTWYDAFAFCIWDGGRLATEMEFEYAAAGGDQNRVYPWGTANPTPELSLAGVTALEDVGSRPAGNARWGHRDLGGSLYNWLFDQYAPYPETCNDCATVSSGTNRVHRGGDYDAPATRGRTANRYTDGRPPEQRLNGVGFRCARDL